MKIANEYYYEITIGFTSCDDIGLYEWWEDKILWLSQRDMDTLRWANGKFCFGHASDISFGPDYECDTLVALIEKCVDDINEADYFGDEED